MERNEVREKLYSRRILGLSKIDEESTNGLIADFFRLNLESEEPIRLIINSNGGDLDGAFALADCLHSLKAPVTGIVIGMCASAALIALLACRERIATCHSRFLAHQARRKVSLMLDDNLEGKLQEILRDAQSMRAKIEDYYISRTAKITREKAKQLMHEGEVFSKFLSVQEAKELGFIQQIVPDDFDLLHIEPTKG